MLLDLRLWEGGGQLCGNMEDGSNGVASTLPPLPIRVLSSFEFPTYGERV